MLRLASGLVTPQIMTYPGGSVYFDAGPFSASRAFSICSERRHYRQRLCLKADPGERLSPRRDPRRSLLPLSPKRTRVRLKSLLNLVWLTPDSLRTHGRPSGKSAVCGLNGHRRYYIISLFKVTYKSTIQVSRNFHALFTKTLENSDTCD